MSFILLGILNSQAEAAGGATDFDLLETTVLSSTATSVSFSSLGSYSDYKHLQLRVVGKSTQATGNSHNSYIRVNSDAGNNYSQHYLLGNGSTVTSSSRTSSDWITLDESIIGSSGSEFGAYITDILDFSNTNKYKTFRTIAGAVISGDSDISLQSGLWMNTNAITSLELIPLGSPTQSWAIGSRFSLYGIKG